MAAVDANLVERVLGGERQAYESLVRAHLQRAMAVAHSVIGPDSAADDVVQEAFFKAYEQLGALSDPGAFPAWLMRIVRNEAISWQRKNRRRGVSLDDAPQLAAADTETDRIDEAAQERARRLKESLPKLRQNYREILALKYEAGLSYEELAESLGTSLANVEKRLYRARQSLLKLMDGG